MSNARLQRNRTARGISSALPAGRGAGKLVAQVSNPLYRSASSLPTGQKPERPAALGCSADWKSAIQQVGNLRYVTLPGHLHWSCRTDQLKSFYIQVCVG